MSVNDHLPRLDRLFADNWKEVVDLIESTIAEQRSMGLFAIATRIEVMRNAATVPWETGDLESPVESGGVVRRKRFATQLQSRSTKRSIEAGTPAELMAEITAMVCELCTDERHGLTPEVDEARETPWSDGLKEISQEILMGKKPPHDMIINLDHPSAVDILGDDQEEKGELSRGLGGKVVEGKLGVRYGHLIAPEKTFAIYEAGKVSYGRPTSDIFMIESVLAAKQKPGSRVIQLIPSAQGPSG